MGVDLGVFATQEKGLGRGSDPYCKKDEANSRAIAQCDRAGAKIQPDQDGAFKREAGRRTLASIGAANLAIRATSTKQPVYENDVMLPAKSHITARTNAVSAALAWPCRIADRMSRAFLIRLPR